MTPQKNNPIGRYIGIALAAIILLALFGNFLMQTD
jgi:hypothetical protein